MSVLSGEPAQILGGGHDGMRLTRVEPLSMYADGMMDNTEVACAEIMRLLDIRTVRDTASRMIHAVVTLGGENAAYAISEFTLRSMPDKELARLIERKVAPVLAETLVGQLKSRA